MSDFHTPVMLDEVIKLLEIKKGSWYIDCNIGGGGHSQDILKKGGRVLGIDMDTDAISYLQKEMNPYINTGDLILVQANFDKLEELVRERKIEPISGVLFDLGLSSHQLEDAKRGFSFNKDAPLDMRMDQSLSVTAKDLVNGLYEGELIEIFRKFGEERNANRIAKKIAEERKKGEIKTTKQLSDLVTHLVHSREKIHPSTRVFQALRMAVNDELGNLEKALPQAIDVLDKGGRLVVISFHSLEDRIVKNFFKDQEKLNRLKILTNKPLNPTADEINNNPRSRSAKLRVAEKL